MKNLYNSLYFKIYDTLYSRRMNDLEDELWKQRKTPAIYSHNFIEPLSAVNLTLMEDLK